MYRIGKLSGVLVVTLILIALSFGVAFAQDGTITYQGQLARDGDLVSATCDMTFTLFDEEVDGVPVESEEIPGVGVIEGFFSVQIPFSASSFDGDPRWLEIDVDCGDDDPITLSPRHLLTSVPYATYASSAASADHATTADSADEADLAHEVDWDDVTGKPVCTITGQVLKWDTVSSNWVCAADDNTQDGNNLYDVATGGGLVLIGGEDFSLLQSCSNGQVLKWDTDQEPDAWVCANDSNTQDGDTTYDAAEGGGLVLDETSFSLLLSCDDGEVLKWDDMEEEWACAPDANTQDGNNTYDAAPGGGLTLTDDEFSVDSSVLRAPETCTSGQVLKYTGTTFGCAPDSDTPTIYTEGTGIDITSNVVSVDAATAGPLFDSRFVNASGGDSMAGPLSVTGVNGNVIASGYVDVGEADSVECDSTRNGALRWNSGSLELCYGAGWRAIDFVGRDVVLYRASNSASNGNLGNRTTTNATCANSSNRPPGYANAMSFITYSSTDSISGMALPNSIPTNVPVKGPNGLVIAHNWINLLSDTTNNVVTLQQAGVLANNADQWWSGSNSTGGAIGGSAGSHGNRCGSSGSNFWTNPDSGANGQRGGADQTGTSWINENTTACNSTSATYLLCVAWTPQ